MRLLSLLLLLIFQCAVWVDAYARAGAFERIFFWNTYLIDRIRLDAAIKAGNDARAKIAAGCKPAPCTFNQLMKYIADNPEAVDFNILDPEWKEPITDLSGTATKLEDNKVTGAYRTNRLMQGIESVPYLFDNMGGFLGGNIDKHAAISPQLKTSLKDSLLGVYRLRQDATLQVMKEGLKKEGIVMETIRQELWRGSSETYEEFDWTKSAAKSSKGLSVTDLKELADFFDDEGHSANIFKLKGVAQKLQCKV